VASFPDDAIGGLLWSEGRGVEPPADIAELTLHISIEIFIAVEIEPLPWITDGAAEPAGLDALCENDGHHLPSREERNEEVRKKSS
jgi:hypothetical protein